MNLSGGVNVETAQNMDESFWWNFRLLSLDCKFKSVVIKKIFLMFKNIAQSVSKTKSKLSSLKKSSFR